MARYIYNVKVKKTKKFNGKIYKLKEKNIFQYPSKRVKFLRKKGYNARIHAYGKQGSRAFAVYIRKK